MYDLSLIKRSSGFKKRHSETNDFLQWSHEWSKHAYIRLNFFITYCQNFAYCQKLYSIWLGVLRLNNFLRTAGLYSTNGLHQFRNVLQSQFELCLKNDIFRKWSPLAWKWSVQLVGAAQSALGCFLIVVFVIFNFKAIKFNLRIVWPQFRKVL